MRRGRTNGKRRARKSAERGRKRKEKKDAGEREGGRKKEEQRRGKINDILILISESDLFLSAPPIHLAASDHLGSLTASKHQQ